MTISPRTGFTIWNNDVHFSAFHVPHNDFGFRSLRYITFCSLRDMEDDAGKPEWQLTMEEVLTEQVTRCDVVLESNSYLSRSYRVVATQM